MGSEIEEILVPVPSGASGGHVLSVIYMGLPYKVMVPDGYGPGMAFQTKITLHANTGSHEAYVCAFCGKLFDKAEGGSSVSKCMRCYERCRSNVCYCDAGCQKADWKHHKAICGKVVE